MKRIAFPAALVCVGAVALLSGCSTGEGDGGGARTTHAAYTPGPTATSTAAPGDAAEMAMRYRQSGGQSDVYGIKLTAGPSGTPLLIIWTHNPHEDQATFDALKGSVTGFMAHEQGVHMTRGYLLDVYGPNGTLQHRLDARV